MSTYFGTCCKRKAVDHMCACLACIINRIVVDHKYVRIFGRYHESMVIGPVCISGMHFEKYDGG